MSPKTIALAAVSALGVAAALAGETMTSASTFLHIDTAQSPFWRTATNNTVEISVDYPDSATTASLEVRGAWGLLHLNLILKCGYGYERVDDVYYREYHDSGGEEGNSWRGYTVGIYR